jgi:conjugal transfer pilus assembly protein TraB
MREASHERAEHTGRRHRARIDNRRSRPQRHHPPQQIAMWGLGGVLVMAGMWWIIASPTPQTGSAEKKDDPKAIKISTDDMVNRSMADKEWMALSENQLTTQGNQIKTLQGDSVRLDQLQKQIEDLQGQNQALKTDGSKVLSAYQTENDQLRSQISALSTQMQRATAGPSALYGTGAPPTYQRASSIPSGSPLTPPQVIRCAARSIRPARRVPAK